MGRYIYISSMKIESARAARRIRPWLGGEWFGGGKFGRHNLTVTPLNLDLDQAGALFKVKGVSAIRHVPEATYHVGRAYIGMARERHFACWSEDADLGIMLRIFGG